MPSTGRIKLLVHGVRGKMGARIAALARDDERFEFVAGVDLDNRAQADAIAINAVNAIIDFTSDSGAAHAAELALKHSAALLVGTTGLSPKTLDVLGHSARSIPLMIAPNTSRGVAVLNHLAAEAARLLRADFDIDIIESHHTMKRDAPSGTALRLSDTIRQKAGVDLGPDRMHSIRAGEIIGEHIVQFAGPGEILKIFHSATNRDLFGRGALAAMAWLRRQKPGRYSIEQSLGL